MFRLRLNKKSLRRVAMKFATASKDDSGDGSWATEADNNCVEKFSLQFYGQGVRFGHGAATKPPTNVSFPGDNVSHINNRVEFTSRGLGNPGYVYLEHQQSTSSYAIGTTFVGGLKILRWGSDDWK